MYEDIKEMNESIKEIIKKQTENENFEREVISPLSDKIISEITSNNLTYNQAFGLLRIVENKIKNLIVCSE